MITAFQGSAFQNSAFQVSGIVFTGRLNLPINCVLMGEQLYEKTGKTFDISPKKSSTRAVASLAAGGRIGPASSFTVTTGSRGYD